MRMPRPATPSLAMDMPCLELTLLRCPTAMLAGYSTSGSDVARCFCRAERCLRMPVPAQPGCRLSGGAGGRSDRTCKQSTLR
eukprot:348586-Rhodomonas_salina.5